MNRRIAIATVLSVVTLVAYMMLSDGPPRVHIVTIPVQMVFLFLISFVFWVLDMGRWKRFLLLLGVIVVTSAVATYLDSKVIRAIFPLHPIHFAVGLVGFLCEATLFLFLTWLIDRGVGAMADANIDRQGEKG